jgi:type VI secretion system protein ImpM
MSSVPGLFGKLPRHGDFVRRGLAPATVARLDAWLVAWLDAARVSLGASFESRLEAMPPQRLVLAPGILAPAALVGVVVSSSDNVGRPFALVLLAPAIGEPGESTIEAWQARAEALAVAATAGTLDTDELAAALADLPLPRGTVPATAALPPLEMALAWLETVDRVPT